MVKTAEFELESMGFDATAYNYEAGADIYAAHTIARKEIVIYNNDIGGNSENAFSVYDDAVIGSFGGNISAVSGTEANMGIVCSETSGNICASILSSADTTNTRPLVVPIRGRFSGWLNIIRELPHC